MPVDVVPVSDLGDLVFTPAANANGTAYASFTFQVRDDGGTANGGDEHRPERQHVHHQRHLGQRRARRHRSTLTRARGSDLHLRDCRLRLHRSGRQPAQHVRRRDHHDAADGRLAGAQRRGRHARPGDQHRRHRGRRADLPRGADANGIAYASFTFQVRDDGGTANGGVDTRPERQHRDLRRHAGQRRADARRDRRTRRSTRTRLPRRSTCPASALGTQQRDRADADRHRDLEQHRADPPSDGRPTPAPTPPAR